MEILFIIANTYLIGFILMLMFLGFIFYTGNGFQLSDAERKRILFNSFMWPVVVYLWVYDTVTGNT